MKFKSLFPLLFSVIALGLSSCGNHPPKKVELSPPSSETGGLREVSSEMALRWDIQDVQILTSQLASKMSEEKFPEIENFPIPLEIGPFKNKTSDKMISVQDLQSTLMASLVRDNRFLLVSTQEMVVGEEMFVGSEETGSSGTAYQLFGELHHKAGEDSGNPTSIFSLQVKLKSPGKPGQQTILWESQVDSGKVYKP